MSTGEIISLIAVGIAFASLLIGFFFNYKKESRENDNDKEKDITSIVEIKTNIATIKNGVEDIKYKVEKLDNKMQNDHEKIIEHDTKIKNLEKEVFKKGA